jgi:hypothetical protein
MPDERVSSSSTTTSGGSHGFLYFAIGALIVAVIVLGWMFYGGGVDTSDRVAENTALERSADAIGDAAEDVSDAVRSTPPPAPAPAPTPPQPAPTTPPAEPSPG